MECKTPVIEEIEIKEKEIVVFFKKSYGKVELSEIKINHKVSGLKHVETLIEKAVEESISVCKDIEEFLKEYINTLKKIARKYNTKLSVNLRALLLSVKSELGGEIGYKYIAVNRIINVNHSQYNISIIIEINKVLDINSQNNSN